MPTGKIKWFDVSKGLGVIAPSDGGKEVSVDLRDVRTETCMNELCEGDRVQYEERQGPDGMKAENVRSLEEVFRPSSI